MLLWQSLNYNCVYIFCCLFLTRRLIFDKLVVYMCNNVLKHIRFLLIFSYPRNLFILIHIWLRRLRKTNFRSVKNSSKWSQSMLFFKNVRSNSSARQLRNKNSILQSTNVNLLKLLSNVMEKSVAFIIHWLTHSQYFWPYRKGSSFFFLI